MTFSNKLSKVCSIAKTAWKWGVRLYLAAYLSTSGYVFYDACHNNKPKQEEILSLEVKRYKLKVNGLEKHLTLVGENHYYNKKDYETAKKLVEEHKYIASEGEHAFDDVSFGNFVYGVACDVPASIASLFYCLGAGRVYSSIDNIAEDGGCKIYGLETVNERYKEAKLKDRINFLGTCLYLGLTAPLSYFEGKNETKSQSNSEEYKKWKFKEWIVDSRDKIMAQNILKIIKQKDVDNLLAQFGKGHLLGITNHLSQQLKIDEIKQ